MNPSSKQKPASKLSKKQRQWLWFVGLYLAGLCTITLIAAVIKWAMPT